MSNTVGHHSHDGIHIRQGIGASGSAVTKVRDVFFYNYEPRPSQRKSLRELLCFPRIRTREDTIEREHDGTCTWLLDTPQYALWRANACSDWRDRLLWIKGQAGAGKSTIIKFAVKQSRRTLIDELILPHFFNARGAAIEHSTEGMYGTLLYWLLKELPKEPLEKLESLHQHHEENSTWEIPGLVEMLEAALKELDNRPITFYIDALDECPQDEIRDMLKVFRSIVEEAWDDGRQVRVCLASRPYPHIRFTHATFIDFSQQEGHLTDLRQYINDELQIGIDPLAKDIYRDVLRKAEGSFMWAKLVVRLLNTDFDGGHKDRLSKRLRDVPSGLSELYSHILKRYPNDHGALLACCQWVAFCKGTGIYHRVPGRFVQCLWWATRQNVDRDEERTRRLYESLSNEDMEYYICDISKGLVEVRSDSEGFRRPQFLHESVREFILNPNDLWHICGARDRRMFEALSNEALRDVCLNVLVSERPAVQTFIKAHGRFVSHSLIQENWCEPLKGKMKRPLAEYAAVSIIEHAEKAQQLGLDQTAFLEDFNSRCGPYFLHPYDIGDPAGYSPVRILPSVLEYLVASGAGELILATQLPLAQRAWSQGQAFGLTADDGQNSILDMLLGNLIYEEAFEGLLSIFLRFRTRAPELQNILNHLARFWNFASRDIEQGSHPPLLYAAMDVPALGSLVVLAFAADGVLDPYINGLNAIFNIGALESKSELDSGSWLRDLHHFLQVFYLLLDERIPSLAITFGPRETLQWLDVALSEIGDGQDADAISCRHTVASLKGLVITRQSSLMGI